MDVNRAMWLAFVLAVALTVAAAAWAARRKRTMFRRHLPRIYELHDLVPIPPPPNAYFCDLDASLAAYPQKLKQYLDIEQDLPGLDAAAWDFLKSELKPLLTAPDKQRGWQALFDKLNQAKGYNYLKSLGYSRVEFIPPSVLKGQRTPDLAASSGSIKALCEVKTINVSEDEASRRHTGGVGSTEVQLDAGFFTKLTNDLVLARTQMAAYDPNPDLKRIAYVIVNYDDSLHEAGNLYRAQIDQFIERSNPTPELDVVFDIKPPFYGAMA